MWTCYSNWRNEIAFEFCKLCKKKLELWTIQPLTQKSDFPPEVPSPLTAYILIPFSMQRFILSESCASVDPVPIDAIHSFSSSVSLNTVTFMKGKNYLLLLSYVTHVTSDQLPRQTCDVTPVMSKDISWGVLSSNWYSFLKLTSCSICSGCFQHSSHFLPRFLNKLNCNFCLIFLINVVFLQLQVLVMNKCLFLLSFHESHFHMIWLANGIIYRWFDWLMK